MTYEEWKAVNYISVPAEFESQCISMGLDPDEEVEKILEGYYLFYLESLSDDQVE